MKNPKDLEYLLENAEVFVISGWTGTGKSWFAANVLKAKIEEVLPISINSKVPGFQKHPFDRIPDWSAYGIWGIDTLSLWEPNSLRAAIEKVQNELGRSRKLAFVVHDEDEIKRTGISLIGKICYIRFTGLGVATVNLGERRVNINLKANKDGSIHFIEETEIETQNSTGRAFAGVFAILFSCGFFLSCAMRFEAVNLQKFRVPAGVVGLLFGLVAFLNRKKVPKGTPQLYALAFFLFGTGYGGIVSKALNGHQTVFNSLLVYFGIWLLAFVVWRNKSEQPSRYFILPASIFSSLLFAACYFLMSKGVL